ncbi:sugar 3,4-ketoisomerase [Paracoccus jiaweipingae]|uniref:sugar 3,4-ketoisomerase n=1 Tax=unclassified Paracoccus (in: a-proteobacteria) TaxID=2688777 RepID=UPI0037A1022D
MQQIDVKKLPSFEDARGSLGVVEGGDLPFDVKRMYYLYNVPEGAIRGEHGHKKLEQLMMCMAGEIMVTLTDGLSRREVLLTGPDQAVHVRPGLWRSIRFIKPGSVLCVLASRPYEPDDYIHSYDEYVEWARTHRHDAAAMLESEIQ